MSKQYQAYMHKQLLRSFPLGYYLNKKNQVTEIAFASAFFLIESGYEYLQRSGKQSSNQSSLPIPQI